MKYFGHWLKYFWALIEIFSGIGWNFSGIDRNISDIDQKIFRHWSKYFSALIKIFSGTDRNIFQALIEIFLGVDRNTPRLPRLPRKSLMTSWSSGIHVYRTCRLKAEETCSHSHQCPVRPWSSLAMPRCQRFLWPLFGARPDERGGEQKSPTKTQKNESFRKQASTNLKDSRSNTSLKVVYTFL